MPIYNTPLPRGSLVTRLTLVVGLTLAALIAVLLAAGFYFGREVLRKEIDAHLSSVASSRHDMVRAHLAQLKQRAELLADHGEFRGLFHYLKTGQPDTTNRRYSQGRLNDLIGHHTILSASLADDTGHVLLASAGTEAGGELAGDPAFENGMKGLYVGPPRTVGDHFEVVLAAPIRDYATPRQNIAVLLMIADISALATAVRDTTGLGQTGEVVLGIRDGDNVRTLFPPRHRKQTLVIPLEKVPAMAAALEGREFLGTTRDYRGEQVLAAALPVGYGGWGLVTKMDTREAYAPIARALRYGLLCGGVVAAAGLIAAYLLARGVARPVQRLVQAASRVAGGDYETSVPIKSADEFGVLAARFNEMTAAIRSRGAERDAKEAALRESEVRLKAIGDHLPGGTIYEYGTRPDGSHFFVYLSAGIERSTTYRAEELFAHPEKVFETVLEEDLAKMLRATRESAENLSVFDHQVRRRMPNGEIRWFHSRSMPRRLDDGNTVWDGVELDVTDYKHAEEEIRKLNAELEQRVEERTRELQAANASLTDFKAALDEHAIVAITDASGKITYANDKFCVISQYSREELIGQDHRIISSGQHPKTFIRELWETINSGRVWKGEFQNRAKDGSFYWVKSTIVPFVSQGGKPAQFIAIRTDITEQKRVEEALRVSEERVRLATEAAEIAVWEWDVKSDALRWDGQMFAIYGLPVTPEGRATYEDWRVRVLPADLAEQEARLQRTIATCGRDRREFRIARASDHAVRVIQAAEMVIAGADGQAARVVGINLDITERKRAEEEIGKLHAGLQSRAAELEEANRELESFSYSVSHDLRAPLRAVNGYARMLLDTYGERLDDEGRRLVGVICREGQRMGRLIDALLAFSRLGRQAMSATPIDMTALAREAFAEAAAEANERKLNFQLGDLPSAHGDRTLLRQVFVNLFSNAVKFTRQSEPAVIEAGAHTEDGETVYWVRDNGAGFDPRYAEQLFGVFQRLHRQDEFEGTGVGLAFVQRIIQRHGGRIWADSQPDKGATFHFTLPQAEA